MSDSTSALSDFLKDLRGAWSTRISNPLVGAFALSWLAINYRALLVLLSSTTFEQKFAYLDGELYADPNVVAVKCFFGPLLLALLYIYALPRPTEAVYRRALRHQRELNEIAREVAGQRLLSQEEAEELLKSASLERAKAKDESDRAQAILDTVDQLKAAHQTELATKESEHRNGVFRATAEMRSNAEKASEDLAKAKRRAADLAWALTYEKALSIKGLPDDEVARRLTGLITAKDVRVTEGSALVGSVKFDQGGRFDGGDSYLLESWFRWKIAEKGRIAIFDDADKQLASYTWDPAMRKWTGSLGRIESEILVQAPADRIE
ncbi:hypothetical protein [Stenotrophomonas bentonitica]